MLAGNTPVLVHNCFNAEGEHAQLPEWNGGQIEGRWAAPGRAVEGIKSGERGSDMAKASRDFLQDALSTPEKRSPIPGNYDHVEQKLAARMFDEADPLDEVDVVINHTGGPCSGRLSCDDVVNRVLMGSGKVMRVHWRDTQKVMNCVEYGIVNGGRRC